MAGNSIGTLYQSFPNKHSILLALMAPERMRVQLQHLVNGFLRTLPLVDARAANSLQQPDESRPLNRS